MARDYDKELDELFAKGQDETRRVLKDNVLRKPKGKARDVMIHVAVTIMGEQHGHRVMGEKDNEICQFAVRIDSQWLERGLTIDQVKKSFEALSFRALERMRVSGLTRE